MAVESSMLGTPAFLLSDRFPKLGYVSRLETEYHLLENFNNFEDLLSRINNIEDINELEQEWSRKAERFKNEVEDVKSVAAGIIEKAGKKCAV